MSKPLQQSLSTDCIYIKGGNRLKGTVKPDGAKNSSLYALIASTYIHEGWMTFDNIPLITDVKNTLYLLQELGMDYIIKDKTIRIIGKVSNNLISYEYASKIRSSIALLGPLLSQFGKAKLPLPGGDKIGNRPIDIHIDVVEQFGGYVRVIDNIIFAELDVDNLKGQDIYLRYPSVGATINAIFIAVLVNGSTEILNAAKEPEIVDLISLLSKMGAKIHGGGTDKITIKGVKKLHATNYTIMPDRLEVGALLTAFAISGGRGTITNCIPEHNLPLIHMLKSVGNKISYYDDIIKIQSEKALKPINIETQPYPGLATDLQAICSAYALTCPGTSYIKDNVFEERFDHITQLIKLGANVERNGSRIKIKYSKLVEGIIEGHDIRSVVSLILATLNTKGETTLYGLKHLERGHINLISKLVKLGADIRINSNSVGNSTEYLLLSNNT